MSGGAEKVQNLPEQLQTDLVDLRKIIFLQAPCHPGQDPLSLVLLAHSAHLDCFEELDMHVRVDMHTMVES